MLTILRAWVLSVLTCAGVVAAVASIMQALTGRWEHAWHSVADITAGFTVVFAFVAALVCVPSFLLLDRVFRVATDQRLMTLVGALVAPVVLMAFRITFAESEDPQTIWGWLPYWLHHPAELVFGSLPFIAPGAIFGFTWSARNQRSTGVAQSRL
jgi:hypothetical protein